jgi:hypothetical protein
MTAHDIPAVSSTTSAPLEKRTWHYLLPPAAFEMASCRCGNHETQWSEFAHHLWCAKCEKDFLPEHTGVLNGPISVKACALFGVFFHRFNIATGKAERYDADTHSYVEDDSLLEKKPAATAPV